jgi:hypothetical protein
VIACYSAGPEAALIILPKKIAFIKCFYKGEITE